jgi:glutamate mutase epsilon subunit
MKLSPEVIKGLSKQQLELLTELSELAIKEAGLAEQIDLNRRQAEKAGLNREKEKTNSLMDDHEYDNLLSVRLIYEREQVKTQIRSVLSSIINAGLGDLDIIRRQAVNYGLNINSK